MWLIQDFNFKAQKKKKNKKKYLSMQILQVKRSWIIVIGRSELTLINWVKKKRLLSGCPFWQNIFVTMC